MEQYEEIFAGGRWIKPAGTTNVDVISPATEEVVARVPCTSEDDARVAVAAARQAFDEGPWPYLTVQERIDALQPVAQYVQKHAEAIGASVAAQMGMASAAHGAGLVQASVSLFREYLEVAEGIALREIRRDSQGPSLIEREPVGVIAAIVPFNGPLPTAVNKVIPALLAGCTVVLKPPYETPLDCYAFAKAFAAADLPPGVFNMLPGDSDIGRYLVEHPSIDMVTFTGGPEAGRRIGATCGENLKKVCLELGGKSAAIVLEDADLEKAGPVLGAGCFRGSGQACIALSRVLAPETRYDEVIAALEAQAAIYLEANGPLISSLARDRVEAMVADAISEGARLIAGGRRPAGRHKGWFFEPTVLADVDNSMRIAQQEVFGPVVVVIPYSDEDDAVRIANDSDFGLHGAVFTENELHGLSIAQRIRTGTFAVNGYGTRPSTPFGGWKHSGLGWEHGPEGMGEFLQYRSISISENVAASLESE